MTVIDQIRLWEMERNRLKTTPGKVRRRKSDIGTNSTFVVAFLAYLYHDFNMQSDFEAAEKHAKDLGVLLWSNSKKRMMVINPE